MPQTVLIVDDEPQIRRALQLNLKARGYQVELAADGAEALRVAGRSHPDAVLLDLGLPDMDGLDVIAGLRGWSNVPIVVLSARGDEAGKVDALDAGADDYVTKPFGIEELLARLRAAIRRRAPAAEEAVVTTDDFTVDLAGRQVTDRNGEPIHLTRIEWGLLEALVRQPNRLVTQRQLLQQVWGPEYETETNYLRVHLTHLRHKLEPDPKQPRYLRTEPGVGYRFHLSPDT
ncbi:MAG: response regulator [Acidimicrobiia bacterium]|nr:response regulator [Acidimicrobiia bacterium]MDH5289012.1 response regulator [Acidimicrobiia bacterium]